MRNLLLYLFLITGMLGFDAFGQYGVVKTPYSISAGPNDSLFASATSQNLAIGPNGEFCVVYSGANGTYFTKSTDGGYTNSTPLQLSSSNAECEIAVAPNGTIYVVSALSNAFQLFTSTNGGTTFSSTSYPGTTTSVDIALDGNFPIVVRTNSAGTSTYMTWNTSSGSLQSSQSETFLSCELLTNGSDKYVVAERASTTVIFKFDTVNYQFVHYLTIAAALPQLSAAISGNQLFIGAGAQNGYKVNLTNAAVTPYSFYNLTNPGSRSLFGSADGTLIETFNLAGSTFRLSNDSGANWVAFGGGGSGSSGINVARNPANGNIVYTYVVNGTIFSGVFGITSTISTAATPATTYCQGSTFALPYTITGTFNAGNVFTAQMSDASGSFTNPVNVGTATATTSGSVNVSIPSGTAIGTGYRFRVISSNPSVIGTTNTTNVSVNALPTATQPSNLLACAGTNFATFYLPQQTPIILNGQSASQFTVSYHSTLNGANNNTNVISNVNSYSATNGATVYARVRNNASTTCFAVTSFQLFISPEPAVDTPDDVISCGPYTLPALSNGNYFSDLNGEGTAYFAGDVISGSTTLYIFNHPDPQGCSATSEFHIEVLPGQTFYADLDSDGFGDNNNSIFSCTGAPQGYVSNNLDCNDNQILYLDADGDGYGIDVIAACGSSVNTDCDDTNEDVWQSATLYIDADGDGYSTNETAVVCYGATIPAGYVLAPTQQDCNDNLAAVHPNAVEIPFNGIDDDCDGSIDEGSQIFTQVLPNQCGTTLANISSYIGATSFGAPVDGYRFRVVNVATNAVQVIDRNVPNFQITQLATFDYASTYSISVQLRRNGQWLNYYGPACQISTPAILDAGGSTSVSPSQCGITLATISTLIATTSLPNVSVYKFRITDTATNVQQELERSTNWFSLTMLNSFLYGRTYAVEVSVKTNGQFSGYGQPCLVNSPAVPQLTNCGATISANGTLVSTTSLNRVTSYRFELTNFQTFQVLSIDRSQNYFSFNNVPGFVPGAQYAVRVSVMTAGAWSDYSEACFITAPGASRVIEKDEMVPTIDFRAVVYPNPYSESFAFDMDSASEENVTVKVYDMIGKLIEQKEVRFDAIESQQFGENYPSGVYNVILAQGGFVKTLRVIKR